MRTAGVRTPRALARGVLGAAALALALASASACGDEGECGVCDEDNLVLQAVGGFNYAGEYFWMVSPTCEGPACPEPFDEARIFVDNVGPCTQTEVAMQSSRGPEEYCTFSPMLASEGLDFVFNNLLDPTTIELVRNAIVPGVNAFEVYDWKTRILEIRGPITRYRADWHQDGAVAKVTRGINLSCIDNLDDEWFLANPGTIEQNPDPYDHLDNDDPAADPCNALSPVTGLPRRLRFEESKDENHDGVPESYGHAPVTKSTRGLWDHRAIGLAAEHTCVTPDVGVDDCCSQCDYALGVQVEKYGEGVNDGAVAAPRRVGASSCFAPDGTPIACAPAIACDPAADRLTTCREFVPRVDRDDETLRFDYEWDDPNVEGEPVLLEDQRIPLFDRVRETHPANRPQSVSDGGPHCASSTECTSRSGHGLAGYECFGTVPGSGERCTMGVGACEDGRCEPPWLVACRVDTLVTGAQGYCVDTRHDDGGAGACFEIAGVKVSTCDADDDHTLTAAECCPPETTCDPTLVPEALPLHAYERAASLPASTRACVCGDPDNSDDCETRVIPQTRSAGEEDDGPNLCEDPARAGQHALKFVTRLGGVIYDPALKGVRWLPADRGTVPRALAESCAEERGLIAPRTIRDGWRANDDLGLTAEAFEDYDRALCSGQEYSIVFATPEYDDSGERVDGNEVLEDKPHNTLEGKNVYTFTTSAFHVVPNSGFPGDSLRIGECDWFSLGFTNKYDLSPYNLDKLKLREVMAADAACDCTKAGGACADAEWECPLDCNVRGGVGLCTVAGGTSCAPTRDELDADSKPCLDIDVAGHAGAKSGAPFSDIAVRVDIAEFGSLLVQDHTYRLEAPGLERESDMADPVLYDRAFWDVCGMPLVWGNEDDVYEFKIDPPRCGDDEDGDGSQLACDNAPAVYNPAQGDQDADGAGDPVDSCPALATLGGEQGDADDDGFGDACDTCRSSVTQYNADAEAMGVPTYLRVRNVPAQSDADHDGIGDACDNCVALANCGDYSAANPWELGQPLPESGSLCQRDDDADMIGDECEPSEPAVGAVGFGEMDDFDQDGLVNFVDGCPRQPVEDPVVCADDSECGPTRACRKAEPTDATGACDHPDADADGVGDACDTCPTRPNALQLLDGGLQEDDADGDFVGIACETTPACDESEDPRPLGFHAVAAAGACCTTLLVEQDGALLERATGEMLLDPDGLPVRLDCATDGAGCRSLPAALADAPGVLVPPPGCDAALAAAGLTLDSNLPLVADAFAGDLNALWQTVCTLPQRDQDFDGIGDACDLCDFAFDPSNEPYVDENGTMWENAGRVCNGDYSAEAACNEATPDPDETGDGGSTSSTG
jgi:hypothetical protein